MIKINCDLCGKANESLARVLIEGVELEVCQECSKFGKVIGQVKKPVIREARKPQVAQVEEKVEILVENYPELTKRKREYMGLSQKDFAKRINEKESLIHKIETGTFEPSLALARKLEKALGIKLIEEYEEKHEAVKKRREEGFTLGDFINIKQ